MKLIPIAVLFLTQVAGVHLQCWAADVGFKVDQTMPFHVVDFVAGAKNDGAGCPSVMISNGRSRGIEVWCKTKDERVLGLVKQLDLVSQKTKKGRVFIVVFNRTTRETYTVSPDEGTLKNVWISVPRSKRTGQIFQNAVETPDSNVIMFLMNRKVIASRSEFKPDDLTPEKIKTVASAAERFLADE